MGKITPPAVLAHIKRFADECLQRGSESDSVYFGSVWLRYARWANEAKDRVRLDRGSFDALLPQHGFPVATKNRIRRVYGCSLAPETDNRFSQRINEGAPMDIFDKVITKLREETSRKADEVDALALRATKAVEAWREAKRSVIQYELAARLGVNETPPVDVQDAGLAVLAACEALPECAAAMTSLRAQPVVAQASDAASEAVPPDDEETPSELPRVSTLSEAAQALSEAAPVDVPRLASAPLPMAIIGGSPSQVKLAWARKSVPRIEWIEMPANTGSQGVIDRIRNKRFSSVLVLSGMLHSGHAERVRHAASAVGVPYASAATAGHGQLREAMATLDAKLRCAA